MIIDARTKGIYSQGFVKNTLVRDLNAIEHLRLNQPELKGSQMYWLCMILAQSKDSGVSRGSEDKFQSQCFVLKYACEGS